MRVLFVVLFLVFTLSLTGAEAEFLGGTVTPLKANSSGNLSLQNSGALLFETKQGLLTIPFSDINLLEYGQKVDRRIAAAVFISPLFLMSKSRKHFLTLGFRDATGEQQSVVFRLGRGDVRVVLSGLEAKTGLPVRYLDVEARKQMGGF